MFRSEAVARSDGVVGRFNLANTLTEGHLFSAAIYEFQVVGSSTSADAILSVVGVEAGGEDNIEPC